MHFRVFSEGQGTEGRIFFGVAKSSNIHLGWLETLDIFLGWMVDAGPEPTHEEKMRVAHPLGFVYQFKPIPVKCI